MMENITSNNVSSRQLTIFYDGNCPLCSLEMDKLSKHDIQNSLLLVNLHQADFDINYPEINKTKAMKILHGYYQGKLLLGLEVTHRAWTLVGKGLYVAPLEWPIIKQASHLVYLLVAKYRHPISTFISQRFGIGSSRCNTGVCYDKSSNTHRRSK